MITEIVHKNAEPWMSFKIPFFKVLEKIKERKLADSLTSEHICKIRQICQPAYVTSLLRVQGYGLWIIF